jgi:16S rRNA (cytosine967-C5)-methyltransferase
MKNTGRIYAFDVSEKRLANLKKRLKRSGASNITMQRISNENDIKIKRLRGKFDRVLVDSPCTGLGTLRRNPDLKWKHNEKSLNELISKQEAILNAASSLCKVGGYLVYATCSILKDENENQVENFVKNNINFRVVPQSSIMSRYKITLGDGKFLKLNSLENNTDCFFGAVFERVE